MKVKGNFLSPVQYREMLSCSWAFSFLILGGNTWGLGCVYMCLVLVSCCLLFCLCVCGGGCLFGFVYFVFLKHVGSGGHGFG